MPDRERARSLAWVAACAIILLLYGLGGVGVMLRRRYMRPTPALAPEPLTEEPEGISGTAALRATTVPPTATLYPTITPVRSEGP
jgi:hypothetical protein